MIGSALLHACIKMLRGYKVYEARERERKRDGKTRNMHKQHYKQHKTITICIPHSKTQHAYNNILTSNTLHYTTRTQNNIHKQHKHAETC
jgi:hypothetical protein